MATTNDSAVVDLGRLKTFKKCLRNSYANVATSPSPTDTGTYADATNKASFSCAMGNNAATTAIGCTAIGTNSKATEEATVAIGASAISSGRNTVAIGRECQASSTDSVAIGKGATTNGASNNTCLGSDSLVKTGSDYNTALGSAACVKAGVNNSVALGAISEATESNEVSIGNSSVTRRIAHVTDPTNDTDAATKKYVDSFITHVIEVTSLASVLTFDQLKELSNNWPKVVLIALSTDTVYFPGSMVTNDQGVNIFTLYAIDSTTNNVIQTGTNHKINLVIQVDIEGEKGNISYAKNCLVFPAIATNPRFTEDIDVRASGQNSIAAGPGARTIGTNSAAIGHNANTTGYSSVAVGGNSNANGASSIAIGSATDARGGGSIAIGTSSKTNNADSQSVALGISSATTKSNQVSIGNKASGLTRLLSNVTDPVEDQDAATRYWTKNADRSDVFATNHDPAVAGGTGEFYLEANADLNWFAVRGYVSWSSFATAWGNMVRLPGTSDNWWIKTALKVPTAMIPKTNFIAYCSAIDYLGDHSVPYSHDHIAVGTDGYIYVSSWATNHGSTPLGIHCLGHRFYM